MACIVEGTQKLRWSVPEWIARNAFFFLIPQLQQVAETVAIANRLQTAMKQRSSFVNLSDFFLLPESQRLWCEAIDRADEAIAAEGSAHWNNPSAYDPFRTSFKKIRFIAGLETASSGTNTNQSELIPK